MPDEEGDGFSQWISAGLTDEEIDAIGPLPRNHGLLGAALHDPEPFRSEDVRSDDRFDGWWPAAHPDLDAFLAVPIVFRGEVVGAFYLANKDGGFDEDDQRLVRDLADHAAVLIEHSRLYEARRELSVLEERNRLARELHDALTQSLFGLRLRLEADDVDGARSLLEEIFGELRSLILQLRPPALERDGLVASLAKHLDVVGRTHGIATRLDAGSLGEVEPDTEQALFRIAQEALTNVVKHAGRHVGDRAPRPHRRHRVARGRRRRSRVRSARSLDLRRGGSGSCPCTSAPPTSAARSSSSPSRAAAPRSEPRCRPDDRRRSACSSSTTIPWSARACARYLGSRDGLEVVGEAADVDDAVRRRDARCSPTSCCSTS